MTYNKSVLEAIERLFTYKIFIIAWILGNFFVIGCTTPLPDYPVQKADAYPLRTQKDGLVLAIYPVTSGTECERYFGGNMMGEGILPVLVVMENRNDQVSYLVSKDQCFLNASEVKAANTTSEDDLPSGNTRMWISSIAGGLPLVYAWAAPAYRMRDSLIATELKAHTISPGRTLSGFVFFTLPDRSTQLINRCTFMMKAQKLRTDEIITIEVALGQEAK